MVQSYLVPQTRRTANNKALHPDPTWNLPSLLLFLVNYVEGTSKAYSIMLIKNGFEHYLLKTKKFNVHKIKQFFLENFSR